MYCLHDTQQMTMRWVYAFLFLTLFISCNEKDIQGVNTTPPSHKLWNELLQEHVSSEGLVDYRGFIRSQIKLEKYLDILSNSPPDPHSWTADEQIAFWINAYNAFAIKLIVDHYPVESIQDLNPRIRIPGIRSVWHKKFFEIGGVKSSLDHIEHKILRKDFDEPRIHFAINCASMSCPPLRPEAYTAEWLHLQLEDQARRFINDEQKNKITNSAIKISKIFRWFKGDFTKNGSLIDYLNTYSKQKIDVNAEISFMPYDWSLNESKSLFNIHH